MSNPLNTSREQWLEEQLHEARERIIELERQIMQRNAQESGYKESGYKESGYSGMAFSPEVKKPPPITGTIDSLEPADTMAKK